MARRVGLTGPGNGPPRNRAAFPDGMGSLGKGPGRHIPPHGPAGRATPGDQMTPESTLMVIARTPRLKKNVRTPCTVTTRRMERAEISRSAV